MFATVVFEGKRFCFGGGGEGANDRDSVMLGGQTIFVVICARPQSVLLAIVRLNEDIASCVTMCTAESSQSPLADDIALCIYTHHTTSSALAVTGHACNGFRSQFMLMGRF